MTQKEKTFVFTNFEIGSEKLSNSKLKICDSCNVDIDHGITSGAGFSDILRQFIDDGALDSFVSNNQAVLDNIIYYHVYDGANLPQIKRVFALTNDLKLYELVSNSFVYQNVQFGSLPKFHNFDQKLYIISADGKLYYYDGNAAITTKNARIIPENIFWFDRRYYFTTAQSRCSVYSSAYDYFADIYEDTVTFTELNLEPEYGNILSFQSINSSVYVFQQYKISTISITNTGKNIRSAVTLSCSILPNSVQKIGTYVVFATLDGIYKFNGSTLTKLFDDIFNPGKDTIIQTACVNQKYYVEIGSSNGQLFELDVNGEKYKKFSIPGINMMYSVLTSNFEFLAVNVKNEGKFCTKYLDFCENNTDVKHIKFIPVYFDDLTAKMLNTIKIQSKSTFKLIIKTEFNEVTFSVNGNFGINGAGILGKIFEFEIQADQTLDISLISLTLTEFEN